jgi:hypothetical protein
MQWITYILSWFGLLVYLGVEPSYTSTTYFPPSTPQVGLIKVLMMVAYVVGPYAIYTLIQKLPYKNNKR